VGIYFFLADTRMVYIKEFETIFNVMARIGGLIPVIFGSLGAIAVFVNQKLFIAEIITKVYNAQYDEDCLHFHTDEDNWKKNATQQNEGGDVDYSNQTKIGVDRKGHRKL